MKASCSGWCASVPSEMRTPAKPKVARGAILEREDRAFSKVVEKAGTPETHLILMEPSKDRDLQAAIKVLRVMTVQQAAVGTKTDRGEIGFHPDKS